MLLANDLKKALVTGLKAYENGVTADPTCAAINKALLAATGGQMPCYAGWIGKRGAVAWVSVGSSCRIGRGEAAKWLKWCGGDIDAIEHANGHGLVKG